MLSSCATRQRVNAGREPPVMPTLREICTAFGPESVERYPPLPLAHRQVIRAIQPCQSGHDGHSLSQCHTCGGHHRVQHSCGNRHCPQCPQQNIPPWLQHHLDTQLPGSPCLRTCPVPATLRPCLRSHHRPAYQALFHASATALTRLATDARFVGTDLPGFPGGLHTWGRQLQYPPQPRHRAGRGLSTDRTTWGPSSAHCFVPGTALAPLSRALFTDARRHAGLLAPSDPQAWTLPWNVHRQATHHGASACSSLAPSVCKVALSHHRLGALTDRTVPCTSRKVGRARLRTAHLDGLAFLRRFLPHVLPEGVQQVRHCGFCPASGALSRAPIRQLIVPAHPGEDLPPPRPPPPPGVARWPTWSAPMRVVMRRWASHRDLVDTGCGGTTGRGNAQCHTVWHLLGPPCAPPALRPHRTPEGGLPTDHRETHTFPTSPDHTPMALPHHEVRRTIPPCLAAIPYTAPALAGQASLHPGEKRPQGSPQSLLVRFVRSGWCAWIFFANSSRSGSSSH